MSESSPSTGPANQHRDVPAWVFVIVILLAMGGGAGFVYWYLDDDAPASIQTVSLYDPAPVSATAADRTTISNELPPARLVTLQLENVSARDAFDQLQTQTGFRIAPDTPEVLKHLQDQVVNVTIDQQPFWVAFDEVARQAAVQPRLDQQNASSRISLILYPDQRRQSLRGGYTYTSGPVQFHLTDLNHTRSVQLGRSDDAINRHLRMTMYMFIEPDLNLPAHPKVTSIDSALDETGRQLVARVTPIHASQESEKSWFFRLYPSFSVHPEAGSRISELRGHVPL